MTKTLKVGIIGAGMAGQAHAFGYRNASMALSSEIKVELYAIADPNLALAQKVADRYGFSKAIADIDELINSDVDAISVALPNFLHAEIGIAAAKAGKAFWIEKPVGRGVAETTSVQEAAMAAGVVSSIGFNYRHAPAVEKAKALIAEGRIGRVTNIRGVFFADYSAEPNGALSWRFNRKLAGSGVLGDLMGHLVDLVQYVVGPVESVSGMTSTIIKQRPIQQMGVGTHFDVIEGGELGDVENEDYAGMMIRFADNAVGAGAVGTLEASRVAVGPRASYNFEIYGTEGSIRWDFERMNELEVAVGRKGDLVGYTRVMAGPDFGDFSHFQPGAGTSMGFDDLKVIEARKFLESFTGAKHLNSNINDAVSSAAVIDAAERSAESGQWIKLSPVPGVTSAIR